MFFEKRVNKRFLEPNCRAWEPLGLALWQYHTTGKAYFKVHSNVEHDVKVPAQAYFKSPEQFHSLEFEMFNRAEGKIADLGAGSGSQTLALKATGKDVDAYEINPLLVKIMQERGIDNALAADVREYVPDRLYDTLFMAMNGIGLAGNVAGLYRMLDHFRSWLAPGGKLLFDTTDVSYVTEADRRAATLPDTNPREFYGVVTYQLSFNGHIGSAYQWIFLDHDTANLIFNEAGYTLTCVAQQGDSRVYEARLIDNPGTAQR